MSPILLIQPFYESPEAYVNKIYIPNQTHKKDIISHKHVQTQIKKCYYSSSSSYKSNRELYETYKKFRIKILKARRICAGFVYSVNIVSMQRIRWNWMLRKRWFSDICICVNIICLLRLSFWTRLFLFYRCYTRQAVFSHHNNSFQPIIKQTETFHSIFTYA